VCQTHFNPENREVNFKLNVNCRCIASEIYDVTHSEEYPLRDSFINLTDVDFVIQHDEPLLEYKTDVVDEQAKIIGDDIARLVEDGSTIQAGYGNIPDAMISSINYSGLKPRGFLLRLD